VTPTTSSDPSNPDGTPTPAVGSACAEASVGPSSLRRLNRLELQLTLKQLFQLGEAPDVAAVPEDPKFKSFRTLADLQTITTQHLRGYADLAGDLARDLLGDAQRRDAVIGCDEASAGCLADFTARFGRLAYRRGLSTDEVATLTLVPRSSPRNQTTSLPS
jgi:hypothetical protein